MASHDEQEEIERIAAEFARAIRAGEKPDVDAYSARLPKCEHRLRKVLSSVALIEGLKRDSADMADTAHSDAAERIPDMLDEYRIVRELGRGGMGVVYEAVHQSLGRRVAIKVLATNQLNDQKQLARFRVEARAAARLRHSNIVPVFGVGHAEGFHYYVMDYVDGSSLREVLNELRQTSVQTEKTTQPSLAVGTSAADFSLGQVQATEFSSAQETNPEHSVNPNVLEQSSGRDSLEAVHSSSATQEPASAHRVPAPSSRKYIDWVAGLGATVCEALDYAHQAGVLHRDIKPANLLLDRGGQVWIADFGLAKLAENNELTQTGDILGTPAYMPPESFEGNYDQASEIYCVGLTLYELLALRPAIEGRHTADLVRKAARGVSVSPSKFNSRIPRDLLTITMKMLAFEPQSRYQTAHRAAEDLRLFLAGRPIQARQVSLLERITRWGRREPKVAGLLLAIIALLSVLSAVSGFAYWRTSKALYATKEANEQAQAARRLSEQAKEDVEKALGERTQALLESQAERNRAEQNLQIALGAFERIIGSMTARIIEPDAEILGEVTDTTSPHVNPRDAQLLRELLGFFDELTKNNADNLRRETAIAASRAGDIYMHLGELVDADRAFSRAREEFATLGEDRPTDITLVHSQAKVLNSLAVVTSLRGQLSRSAQAFFEVKELIDPGLWLEEDAVFQESESSSESTEPIAESAIVELRFQYARAHRLFASLAPRTGLQGKYVEPRGRPGNFQRRLRSEMEWDAIETATQTLEELSHDEPDEIRFATELARAYRNQAEVAARAGRYRDAQNAIRSSIEIFEDLLRREPSSSSLKYELAISLISTESFGFNQLRRASRAMELSNGLVNEAPGQPRYQALQAQAKTNVAAIYLRANDSEKAATELVSAIESYTKLLANTPELAVYETRRVQAMTLLAAAQAQHGDKQLALETLESAKRRLQPKILRRRTLSPATAIQLREITQRIKQLRETGSQEEID